MYDFRRSRDIVNNPDGSHSVVARGYNKLDVCEMPVQLYYADRRLMKYFGQWLGDQQKGLVGCQTPCIVSNNKSDADVLVGIADPPFEGKLWWQRTAAVILDPQSLHPNTLAATDMLIGFHRQSDVRINYLHSLSRGTPCSPTADDVGSPTAGAHLAHCLSPDIQQQLQDASRKVRTAMPEKLGQRKSDAVIFMNEPCSRHAGFAEKLINAINWDM